MENSIKEYLKQLKSEELELVVRISWCQKKGSSGFDMIENCYKARARFDMALNVRTGELLDTGAVFYNWLEWLAPKKLFGFKYGYKFQKGKLYRILVRERLAKKGANYRAYYIEQVLEQDINEPRLDAAYNFESKFEETVTDLTVLTKQRIYGWAVESNYRIPKATFIASIDNRTNALSSTHGTLEWIEKDRNKKIKFNFNALEAYHVKARKSKENNNSYLLLDVIKKVVDDRLENIKEEYLKPVIIKNELGEFRLDRDCNWFEGKIDYLGEVCNVYLKVEEGELTADKGLSKLNEIYQNLESWSSGVREYVSDELLELAYEWLDDDGEITKEEFMRRIGIPDITIQPDGVIHLMFDSDGIFNDHVIVVVIDKNGDFIRAVIEG